MNSPRNEKVEEEDRLWLQSGKTLREWRENQKLRYASWNAFRVSSLVAVLTIGFELALDSAGPVPEWADTLTQIACGGAGLAAVVFLVSYVRAKSKWRRYSGYHTQYRDAIQTRVQSEV